jgi:hypothetical protein
VSAGATMEIRDRRGSLKSMTGKTKAIAVFGASPDCILVHRCEWPRYI